MAVRRWVTNRNARCLIAAVVLLSVLEAVPFLLNFSLVQKPYGAPGETVCIVVHQHVLQIVNYILFNVLLGNIL